MNKSPGRSSINNAISPLVCQTVSEQEIFLKRINVSSANKQKIAFSFVTLNLGYTG